MAWPRPAADFQRQQGGGRGGAGGPGGINAGAAAGAAGLPPGMSALDNSNLGLGGLGATAINGGFGGGDPSGGGGAGFGGGGGGANGGGGGGGGGRGGGGGGGGEAVAAEVVVGAAVAALAVAVDAGGPNPNASFGNRRRNAQPAYTGSIALTLANSALNAAPFSLNGTTAVKPSSDRAAYVGNLGGPMVIPKILNWPRAQFQLNYQGTTQRNGSSQLSEVPTPDQRAGNFSGLTVAGNPVTIYDPTTGQPFLNNTIPLTRFDNAGQAAAAILPAADVFGWGNSSEYFELRRAVYPELPAGGFADEHQSEYGCSPQCSD